MSFTSAAIRRHRSLLGRVARAFVIVLSWFSLSLAVLVGLFWVRSYKWEDSIGASGSLGIALLSSKLGGVELYAAFDPDKPQFEFDSHRDPGRVTSLAPPAGNAYRFGFHVTHWFRHPRLYTVAVPHWFLVLLAGAAPAIRIAMSVRGRRRSSTGRCRQCGYDLRATPERCPECGEPTAAPIAAG